MTRIELAPGLVDDFDRVLDHLVRHRIDDAVDRVQGIVRAIDVLQHNPLIGRSIKGPLRELVIGRLTRGYVALYRYVPEIDTVFVLALRSQREAGFAKGE